MSHCREPACCVACRFATVPTYPLAVTETTPNLPTVCRLDQSLRGHARCRAEDFPRHYPLPSAEACGSREGFAVMSGCARRIAPAQGKFMSNLSV